MMLHNSELRNEYFTLRFEGISQIYITCSRDSACTLSHSHVYHKYYTDASQFHLETPCPRSSLFREGITEYVQETLPIIINIIKNINFNNLSSKCYRHVLLHDMTNHLGIGSHKDSDKPGQILSLLGALLYPPQTVFVEGYTVFALSVRTNERKCVRNVLFP